MNKQAKNRQVAWSVDLSH